MIHILPALVVLTSFLSLFFIVEVTSYSKVSKNGQQTNPVSTNVSTFIQNNGSNNLQSEGRSVQDITITVSPIYRKQKIPKLQPGEAADYPSAKKYPTLNRELLSKVNSMIFKKQLNDRYTPPSIFQTGKKVRGNSAVNGGGAFEISKPDVSYSRPDFPGTYDYVPSDFQSDNSDSKPPMSKPPVDMNDEFNKNEDSMVPDFVQHTYESQQDLSNFDGLYEDKPPAIAEYSGHHFDHPTFIDDHDFPDDHQLYHHHHDHDHYTTTERPEMNDQRLSKRPYSYYYIGKKLWYIPLYFSIYFIIYVAALVLKSVARHKINFPTNLAAAAADARNLNNSGPGWWDLTRWVLQAIDNYV